ncbi:cancer-related nucleoside-triphosphatase homolog [Liolophura sinensis]|uniref:cancer-related nucleoside-triphosphatase homolog n=1 Tax=Liolophura sinensis TaxID=3198878 RepID=UPI0031589259
MATGFPSRHVLLTGPPGVGKTTLVRKACQLLKDESYPIKGFYTEEVRKDGHRIGFDVVTLDNQRGKLARLSESTYGLAGRRECRVGQYSVDVPSFECTALPSLQLQKETDKVVCAVDEIGKMELFSSEFVHIVRHLFDNPKYAIIATLPIQRGRPITMVEEIRNRKDVTLFNVSKPNRDSILEDIVNVLRTAFDQP